MMSHDEFIEVIADEVVQRSTDCRIVPSVIIAHATIISKWGSSDISVQANNLFGILADVNWDGGIYVMSETFHTAMGGKITKDSRYKKYNSWKESIDDFVQTVLSNPKYNVLRNCDIEKCRKQDIEHTIGQFYRYPESYGELLKTTIEKNELRAYDSVVGHHNPYNIAQIGDEGDIVRWVQYELARRGYRCTVIGFEDGIFEYNLMKKVMEFQKDQKLPVTGIVDLTTLSLLASKRT